MSTYTGAATAKRGFFGTLWLAVVAFLAAAAIVTALVVMQNSGLKDTSTNTRVGTGPAPTSVAPGRPYQPIQWKGNVCHQCR